jgi:outer membrane protein
MRMLPAGACAGLAMLASSASAETLADALAAAYQNNPTLQAQRAQQRAIDEEYVQARSGWRPTLSLSAEAIFDERRVPDAVASFTNPPLSRGNEGLAGLIFTQPLWTGGRTAAAVTAANADVLEGRENLRRVENQVMAAVIQAYADVRRDEQSLIVQQQNVESLAGQLKEAQARFDVGEVTRTDVAQAQGRLAASQAQLQSVQAQLAISRANYAAFVGHNPGTLEPEPSLAYLMPGNVDDAFTVAEQNSPVLRAQQFAEQASRARIAAARAERMPNVSVEGRLTFDNGAVDPFEQGTFQRDAQATVTLSLPLFNGGLTTSRIRQAVERNNSDKITVELQRRNVLQTLAQGWNQLLAARANSVITEEQVRATTVAAQGTQEEYRVGLRTTIDVLNAEQERRAAQLNRVSALHDEYVASASVLAAMGRLEARNLIPSQPMYDASANYRRLRVSWGWVPWEVPFGAIDQQLAFPRIPESHDLPREPTIPPGLQPQPASQPAKPAR